MHLVERHGPVLRHECESDEHSTGRRQRPSDLRGPINVLYHSRSYVPLKVRAFIDFYVCQSAPAFRGGGADCVGRELKTRSPADRTQQRR